MEKEEEFEKRVERDLWDQLPASVGSYLVQAYGSNVSEALAFSALKFDASIGHEEVLKAQEELCKPSFNFVVNYQRVLPLMGLDNSEDLQKDYEKWSRTLCVPEQQEERNPVAASAGIDARLSELIGIEGRKKEASKEVRKALQPSAPINVGVENNKSKTASLEQWLDDVLS